MSVRVLGGGLELADRTDLDSVFPGVPGNAEDRAVEGLAQGAQGGRFPGNVD